MLILSKVTNERTKVNHMRWLTGSYHNGGWTDGRMDGWQSGVNEETKEFVERILYRMSDNGW